MDCEKTEKNIADTIWNKLTCNFDIYSLGIASVHCIMMPILSQFHNVKNFNVTFQTSFIDDDTVIEIVFFSPESLQYKCHQFHVMIDRPASSVSLLTYLFRQLTTLSCKHGLQQRR